MKAKPSGLIIAAMCVSMVGSLTLFGCQDKQSIDPGNTTTVTTDIKGTTSAEEFDKTLLQALETVGDESYCKVSKVEGGYDITIIPGSSTQERTVCSGGGAGFVRCVKGYVDGGIAITIVRCTPEPYCGNAP